MNRPDDSAGDRIPLQEIDRLKHLNKRNKTYHSPNHKF